MHWRPKVTMLRCDMPCQTWVGSTTVNAQYCHRPNCCVCRVEDCGPPRCSIDVCCHLIPKVVPLEFIIPCLLLVCTFSAQYRGRTIVYTHHESRCGPRLRMVLLSFQRSYTRTGGARGIAGANSTDNLSLNYGPRGLKYVSNI